MQCKACGGSLKRLSGLRVGVDLYNLVRLIENVAAHGCGAVTYNLAVSGLVDPLTAVLIIPDFHSTEQQRP